MAGGAAAAKRAASLRGDHLRREIDAQCLGNAGAVPGIGPVAVYDLPLDDLDRHAFHRGLVIIEELRLLVRRHQAEQIARLTVVIVAVAMIVAVAVAPDFHRPLPETLLLHPPLQPVPLLI